MKIEIIKNCKYIGKEDFINLTSYTYLGKKIIRERTYYRIIAKNINNNNVKIKHGKKYIKIEILKDYISNYFFKILMNKKVKLESKNYFSISEFAEITKKSTSTIRRFINKIKNTKFDFTLNNKTCLIKRKLNNYYLHRILIKQFVSEDLISLEEDLLIKKQPTLTSELNKFINQVDWSLFGCVTYENNKNKDSCIKNMVNLYNYVVTKTKNKDVAIYHVTEPNSKGYNLGYHTHFIIYSGLDNKSKLKNISDSFLRAHNDAQTKINYFDNNRSGVEYLNKLVKWNNDSYGLEINNNNIFLK